MRSLSAYKVTTTLCETGDIATYRAVNRDEWDGRPVLIKVPASVRPSVSAIRRLEHEYEVARDLDPEFAATPLKLERRGGTVVLVLQDGGANQILEDVVGHGTRMELGLFLRLAIRISAAVGEVHRRDLIHRDIKPSNILLQGETGEIRITGFGIASRIPHEVQAVRSPCLIEGTLAYMSPEQTGRMNRSLDYRSDFYSLGVTFYEMLTGVLPFHARDPMEWVYCHIAQQPQSPSALAPQIPEMVSAIVLKLLAKVAEDRYQSAAGLQHDLEKCLVQWDSQRTIEPFHLGEGDISDRFQIPCRLYGRDEKVAELLSAFDRVSAKGSPELVLVSGYSGIGKSALVQELHQPIVQRRGFFISGKFDQLKRDIPYSTIVQAFHQLIQQILAESDERIATWRRQLAAALGLNGQLICDLIPEVELIIGKQPPVIELPLTQAQDRFHLVFLKFLGVFAKAEHPLTVFLDDLQWSDSASLQLIQYLLANQETHHLLVVGSYRDNEVTSSHLLMLMVEEIRNAGVPVRDIVLSPLSLESLNQFVADALHCELNEAALLSHLVHEKTGGNPFFIIQLLTGLHSEGLIIFNARKAAWQWDIQRIRAEAYTDNVVEFLVGKFSRLSAVTRSAMQLAACIGQKGPIRTLALIYGKTEEETMGDLHDAMCEGLILRLGDEYQFLHDRVQEAAYSLTPKNLRPETHLRIGRLLLADVGSQQELEEKIFDIVNQLNRGADLISSLDDKVRVAELNLIAGRRAKTSTAYTSAVRYFSIGIKLLGGDLWSARDEVAYSLNFGRAQCEYLDGNFEVALMQFDELLAHAKTKLQKADIYCAKVDIYTQKTEMTKAVEAGIEGLQLFGIDLSPHPNRLQVLTEYEKLWRNLGDLRIEELAGKPRMTDPEMFVAMKMLEVLYTGALCTDQNLFVSWACHMVNISLCHGNCDASAMGYGYLGLALGPVFGRYREGYEFGKLGYNLVEKHGLIAYKAKINFIFGDCISYWHRHLREDAEYLQIAFQSAGEIGDLITACYCCNHIVINLLVLGEPLDAVHREAERRLEFTRRSRLDASSQAIIAIDRVVQNMRGCTAHFSTFSDDHFDQDAYEAFMDGYGKAITTCWYYIMKLQARFMSGDFEEAIAAAGKASPLLWSTMAHIQETEYWYYYPLAVAARYHRASQTERREALQVLRFCRNKLREWVENCPENFQHKYALVSAEVARITRKSLDEVMVLYEQAIRSARENGFVQNEGIANELAAGMYFERGYETIGRTYLREARYCYVRWGADGKVEQLDQRYPWLRESRAVQAGATIAAFPEQLDLTTVVKAVQAISGEIVTSKLVEMLLRIVLENAGAQKGYLVMEPDAQLLALVRSDKEERRIEFYRAPPSSSPVFPSSILNYVKRTRQTVILSDASTDAGQFSSDEYLEQVRPKSVLCMPIMRQLKLIGVLYLENNLATGAFTFDRHTALEMLAAQAAVSLETAKLYGDLQGSQSDLQRQTQILRSILNSIGDGVSVANERCEIFLRNPAAAEILGLPPATAGPDTWAEYYGLYLPDQITPFPAKDLPLARAVRGEAVDDVEMYMRHPGRPDGAWLSFSARPLTDNSGTVRGGVVIFSDITARKKAEHDLRQAKEVAEEANRAKDRFLAMLSHELRTPLTPVLSGLDALSPSSAEDRSTLEMMRRNIELQRRLIDDLLDLTRISRAGLRLNLMLVNAHEIVRKVLETCEVQISAAGLNVELSLGAAKPWVRADSARLQQVVWNLVQNAARYTPSGGRLIIRSSNPSGGEFALTFADTGIGIDPADLERVFRPFEQANRTVTRGYGGLGLGLTIAKELMEAQGGAISVESKGRGQGSTFMLNLKTMAEPALPLLIANEGPPAVSAIRKQTRKLRILLVEDHTDTRQTLQRLLARRGFDVISAPDVHSALETDAREHFDLLISDIGLPDGTGYDFLKTVRSRHSVRAIALSGLGMETDIAKSRTAGFAEHLVKPVDLTQLVSAIRRVASENA